jgi:hypothetical protein
MNQPQIARIESDVVRFTKWLDGFGETSYDHQSYFASKRTRAAKAMYYKRPLLGKIAVAPMIFSEAFVPSARRLFWKPMRFPIADAHYAMGFAFLSQALGQKHYYDRAVHFLRALQESRSPGFENYCWGYPFDWETRRGPMWEATPLITTVPYAYEAFREVYLIDGNSEWRDVMHSIARHAVQDYPDVETSASASSCFYKPGPEDSSGVVNASAYRAFLLTAASVDFADDKYRKIADRNVNFVLQAQTPDGSWPYSVDEDRLFVDHFHTCFVLKALAKIEALTKNPDVTRAIERGVDYYVKNLFDDEGLPKPFSRRPRMTVYKRELYDYAECINVGVLLEGRFPQLDANVSRVVDLEGWRKSDGSFRSRQLLLGWDNVPMHRWAQSQLFRSLSFLLYRNSLKSELQAVGAVERN